MCSSPCLHPFNLTTTHYHLLLSLPTWEGKQNMIFGKTAGVPSSFRIIHQVLRHLTVAFQFVWYSIGRFGRTEVGMWWMGDRDSFSLGSDLPLCTAAPTLPPTLTSLTIMFLLSISPVSSHCSSPHFVFLCTPFKTCTCTHTHTPPPVLHIWPFAIFATTTYLIFTTCISAFLPPAHTHNFTQAGHDDRV